MGKYLGDFAVGSTIRGMFNSNQSDGTPITLAGTPVLSCYKLPGLTESVAGVTLAVDFDGKTGLHAFAVDTSADGAFYATASDFALVLTAGTVNAISVVGTEVAHFSLQNRSALRPATAGRTIVVDASGHAAIDWGAVANPTAPNVLTQTSTLVSVGTGAGQINVAGGIVPVQFPTIDLTGVVAASPAPTATAFTVTLDTPLNAGTGAADLVGRFLTFSLGGPRFPAAGVIIAPVVINTSTSVALTFATGTFGSAPVATNPVMISS